MIRNTLVPAELFYGDEVASASASASARAGSDPFVRRGGRGRGGTRPRRTEEPRQEAPGTVWPLETNRWVAPFNRGDGAREEVRDRVDRTKAVLAADIQADGDACGFGGRRKSPALATVRAADFLRGGCDFC